LRGAGVVIGVVLSWFELDLLKLARAVAAPDLPGALIGWVTGSRWRAVPRPDGIARPAAKQERA
jgi:hypothetical protein